MTRWLPALLALGIFAALASMGWLAPQHLSEPNMERGLKSWAEFPPFGTDSRGRPLLEYAAQGARVVVVPAVLAGCAVALMSVIGGLLRCVGDSRVDTAVAAFGEVVGALPRMVVILVVAILIPSTDRSLLPLALAWAVLCSPGAMDEAAAVAERLGGARFVEALRAHGFSWNRIFLYHIVGLNLRPVVVRQACETMTQVTFLELALSYLSVQQNQSSFTHADDLRSWADLLKLGYPALVIPGVGTGHALAAGLFLVGSVVLFARLGTFAARAR